MQRFKGMLGKSLSGFAIVAALAMPTTAFAQEEIGEPCEEFAIINEDISVYAEEVNIGVDEPSFEENLGSVSDASFEESKNEISFDFDDAGNALISDMPFEEEKLTTVSENNSDEICEEPFFAENVADNKISDEPYIQLTEIDAYSALELTLSVEYNEVLDINSDNILSASDSAEILQLILA